MPADTGHADKLRRACSRRREKRGRRGGFRREKNYEKEKERRGGGEREKGKKTKRQVRNASVSDIIRK